MPIYEYRCLTCGKKTEFITFRISEELPPLVCSNCGGTQLTRLVSRVRVRLSEETRLERLADPSRWGHFDENNPRDVARFMKTIGQEMGGELDSDDIDALVEEASEDSSEDEPEENTPDGES
ncbi:MAG: zinc ribbon domain-containing protein [Thermodesulforhabdaceae bacterium]